MAIKWPKIKNIIKWKFCEKQPNWVGLGVEYTGFPQTGNIGENPGKIKIPGLKNQGIWKKLENIREFYFGTPWYFCYLLHFTCLNYLNN